MQNVDNPDTAFQINANHYIRVEFRLGNSSNVRRRLTVIIHDADFSDQQVCIFWIEPFTPLINDSFYYDNIYSMYISTNEVWTQPSLSFYDPNSAPFLPSFQIDDITMTTDGPILSKNVRCNEPRHYAATPTPASPTTNVELLQNGNFSQGYAPWVRADTAANLVGGKLDFYKSGGGHVLYQDTKVDLPQYAALQLVMEASNTSNVQRRMTVILNAVNWSDFRYCNFWLPANTTTQVFLMKTYILRAWTDVNVSIYDSYGTSGTSSIRIDNVRLRNGGIPTDDWTDCETNPPFCPAGFVEDTRSGCAAQTYSLADYGIELNGTWTPTEQNEILTGVGLTGQALAMHGAGDGDPVQAFREVMQGMNASDDAWRRIQIYRSIDNSFCNTTGKATPMIDPNFSAAIICNPSVNMTQYTMVHELGHVFSERTPHSIIVNNVSITTTYFREQVKYPNNGAPLLDSNDDMVLGFQGYIVQDLNGLPIQRIDWQRSNVVTDNGWGSAALWSGSSYSIYQFPPPANPSDPTRVPVYIPNIGPCGKNSPAGLSSATSTPYFQQNPCTFPSWEYGSLAEVDEVEEAAADMFLNWTYSVTGPLGFSNFVWRGRQGTMICYPNGCPDPTNSGNICSDPQRLDRGLNAVSYVQEGDERCEQDESLQASSRAGWCWKC